AKVGADRYSLRVRHAHISIAQVQHQVRVAPRFRSQPCQVIQRCVHDELPGLGAALQLGHLRVYVEELIGQLPDLDKPLLGNDTFTIDKPDACKKAGEGKNSGEDGDPESSQEFASSIPG